jgi:hypothetical protein
MKATIHSISRDPGLSPVYLEVPVMLKPLWWQEKGLSFTASGYVSRIPTSYMVKVANKWRRVYCCIHSNIGTCFIGKKYDGTNIVDLDI